jgi:hypothetical protein
MLKRLILAATLTGALPTAGQAQFDSVREQGDRACRSDATRFCRGVQGDFAVLACLQANANRIRRVCRDFLRSQGQL